MIYSAPIHETIKRFYKNNLENIVICQETAASVLGLVTEDGKPILFYHNNNSSSIINSSYISGIYKEELILEDTILYKGIYCTNKERTICELIKYERDIQAILESIYDYNSTEDISVLKQFAEKYGVLNELEEYITEAQDYYNEG